MSLIFPKAHWSDSSGWLMAEFVYAMVQEEIRAQVTAVEFVAVTCDETMSIDNGSWLSIHAYICYNCERIPFLAALSKVCDAPNADNLLEIILRGLEKGADLGSEFLEKKLLCFNADGASTMQGCCNGVTVKLQQNHAPFTIGQYCYVHNVNFAAKTLSNLAIFQGIESLMQKTWSFFNRSAKRLQEFKKLIEACLAMVLDPYTLLGICALIPLLETINTLIVFAQKQDVLVCNFVAALEVCEGQLYSMYIDRGNCYSQDEFWALHGFLDCSHESIHLKWVCDLNETGEA